VIHRSPCLYISQTTVSLPPPHCSSRIAHPTKQRLHLLYLTLAAHLHVLSLPTPMGGDHNTHREPPPTPHQPGAWNMIPTTTPKEAT